MNNTKIFFFLRSNYPLIITKLFSMVLMVSAYAYCIFLFSVDYAVAHASIMLIFGVFKSGAGFETISTGNSAYHFILRNLISRFIISSCCLYIAALFFNYIITISVIIGFVAAVIWVKAFDMHYSGKYLGSLIYSLIPFFICSFLGVFFYFGQNELNINIYFEKNFFFIFAILALTASLLSLKNSAEKTITESLHSTISPFFVIILSKIYIDNNEEVFIIYKGFEAIAQISIFVLSSAFGRSLPDYSLKEIGISMFLLTFPILLFKNFLGIYFEVIFFGILILSYYISSFFIVRNNEYINKYFISVFLLMVLINVKFIDSSRFFLSIIPISIVIMHFFNTYIINSKK